MMQSRTPQLLIINAFLLLLGSTSQAQELFSDSFESRDLSKSNTDGFTWGGPNRTSLVMQHPANGNMVVMKGNGDPANVIVNDGRDWTAHHGDISMRFRYPAGENWSEQRFSLGGSHREIWFSFWLRVPHNFKHETNSSGGSSFTNKKLFAVWMDGYSTHGDGPTVIWEFWNNQASGSDLAVHFSEGGHTVAGGHLQHTPFISFPEDQGRWMHLVFHLAAATNDTSNDGVVEMWHRWESEADYTRFHQITDANIPVPTAGPHGWANGYLMGWTNAKYVEDTEWLLDSFTVSTSSLLANSVPPSAPVLFVE